MRRHTTISAANRYRNMGSHGISSSVDPGSIHPALEELENQAYRIGYDVKAQGDDLSNAVLELVASNHDNTMPELTIWLDTSEMNSNGVVYIECSADFPSIATPDLEFADSAESILDTWQEVSRFMTWIMKNPIELDMWEN